MNESSRHRRTRAREPDHFHYVDERARENQMQRIGGSFSFEIERNYDDYRENEHLRRRRSSHDRRRIDSSQRDQRYYRTERNPFDRSRSRSQQRRRSESNNIRYQNDGNLRHRRYREHDEKLNRRYFDESSRLEEKNNTGRVRQPKSDKNSSVDVHKKNRLREGRRRRKRNDRKSDSASSSSDSSSTQLRNTRGVVSDDEDEDVEKNTQQNTGQTDRVRKTINSSTSWDDTVGHFRGEKGTVVADRYRIIREVGLGTFGRVLECLDLRRRSTARNDRIPNRSPYVAIKIVRRVKRYYNSALIEARIVAQINQLGGRGMSHCVIMHDSFPLEGHFCLVFESLGPSLYDFLKRHDYQPFPMVCVQDFTVQLLETLEFLHSLRLIHTDLKIENILLMNDREVRYGNYRVPESTKIKVIDFGGACYDSDKKSSVINTRQYRAPEVILGTGWSMPSDMWSAGCILCELYQGELLFPTHDNIEHLALIERIIGYFPPQMVKLAKKDMQNELAREAFDCRGQHRMERVLDLEKSEFVRRMPRLEYIVRNPADSWFLGLLRQMLHIDPLDRATARECLQYLTRNRKDAVLCGIR